MLAFGLLPFSNIAQENFIKPFDLGHLRMLFTNILLHDDTLVVSGLSVENTFPYLWEITLTKLDTNGNILSHHTYMDSLGANYSFGETPRGFIRCSDASGYVMRGHAFERSTGLAMKIGNSGNQLWVKEYPDNLSEQDFYLQIIEVSGGFLIAGIKSINYDGKIFIKKINHQGEGMWEKYYDTTPDRHIFLGSILKLDENEIVIGGNTSLKQQGPPWVPWNQVASTIRIFAIDSLGNEKWSWESEPTLEEFWIRGLNLTEEGNWIYTTARGEFEFDGYVKYQPRVIVRDSNFEIVKEIDMDEFAGNNGHVFMNLVPLADGGFLGLGSNRVFVDTPIVAQAHLRTWMSRMDMDGDTLWERKDLLFPDTLFATSQFLHSAVELPSGSIIAAGYYASFADPKNWGILIKVNKDGCIDTLNCTPINSIIQVPTQMDMEIRVYPNPAHSIVHFDSPLTGTWDRIELFDFSGRKVKEEKNANQIGIHDLPAGVYYVRLWRPGGFATKKIVKK